MAEEALKKLDEELNCLVCLDTYIEPKQLQCHHVFCRKCLVPLVVRDQQGQLTLSCPTCRQVTPVPASGVAGLQSAFHINNLLEIQDSVKKLEVRSITPVQDDLEDGTEEKITTKVSVSSRCCSVHKEKELELYCETCEELICTHCAIKGGKHYSHDYELISKAFESYQCTLTSLVEPVEGQLTDINKALIQFDSCSEEVADQHVSIEERIEEAFMQYQQMLDRRKTELVFRLRQLSSAKQKDLAERQDQLERAQAQRTKCLEMVRESLATDPEAALEELEKKPAIVKQLKELAATHKPDLLELNTEADMMFKVQADATSLCQNYGQVSCVSLPDPSRCYATGSGTVTASVGERAMATLKVLDFRGRPCSLGKVKSFKCELVSNLSDIRVRGRVDGTGEGQYYEISYQPIIKGRHQLHITAEGQHVRGSPFDVLVRLPVKKLGTPLLTIGGLCEPDGVAINQRGEVVVSESGGHCISVFSPSGKKLCTQGSGAGKFVNPCGVAIDSVGNIFVADSENSRIHKFSAAGQFLNETENKFKFRARIACNPANDKIYVVGSGADCVQVLNPDLTLLGTFGKTGSGKGHLSSPCGVACDGSGRVFVADSDNHRIQVFSAEGKFLWMFGRRGKGRGELKHPEGIVVDTGGMVYVSEAGNCRVSIFTSEGEFVTLFGRRVSTPLGSAVMGLGGFGCPSGLAVDRDGVIYVCDRELNHLLVF